MSTLAAVQIACISLQRTFSPMFHAGQKLLPEMAKCLGNPVPLKAKHVSVHPSMALVLPICFITCMGACTVSAVHLI